MKKYECVEAAAHVRKKFCLFYDGTDVRELIFDVIESKQADIPNKYARLDKPSEP